MKAIQASYLLGTVARFHITTIAALGAFTFGWLFMGEYPWLLTLVCAFDWYVVNLVNRIVDFKEDRVNAIVGTTFVASNRRLIFSVIFFFLLLSLVVVHFLNPAITGLRITGHLLGSLYNWPLLPGRRRLKELYFWKNVSSAAGFLITLFGYPLAMLAWEKGAILFPPGIGWATVMITGIFFLLFEVSYEIIYDLRDVIGDALAGVRTYPVVHGERVAVYIIDGLMLLSVATLTAGYMLALLPWRIFIMIGAPILQFIIYKKALRRGISAKDCTRMTWMGATLLFIYHIWVFAKLPGSEL